MSVASILQALRGPCRHQPAIGWCGGAPYGRLAYRGTDGMGITHVAVVVQCRHCGKDMDAVRFHTTDATLATHEEAGKALERCLTR